MKNLILHIEQIRDKDFIHEFEENPEAFPVLAEMVKNRECEFLEPLKIGVRAFRVRDIFEVEGFLQTRVQLPCSRCLTTFKSSIHSDFALTYTNEIPGLEEGPPDEEIELSIEAIGLMVFRGDKIDLSEGLQEQMVMAFPVKPLCNATCKGLCPQCGANLNREDCGCFHRPSSNKFAVLKNLKLTK